jgi:DNA-binding SARP family transcriptional activator
VVGERGLSIRLLGRVSARNGTEVALGPRGPRSLFAVLASRPGTAFGIEQLIDALWGEAVPRSAEGGIYTYVSTLRKALSPGWVRGLRHPFLTSGPAGYALEIPAGRVDLCRFETAEAEARRRWADRDLLAASVYGESALAACSGPSFGGVAGPYAERERARIELARLDVEEIRHAAAIELDKSESAISRLSDLAADHPLRERLHELLILALYRSGQQAEALDVYQRIRRRLDEELGIEPGPGLREAYQQVLVGRERARPMPRRVADVVPAQLPHCAGHFVGRDDEVRRAVELVDSGDRDNLPILAIDGTAGVGKTTLAVRVARLLSAGFPGGQLFLDLRGFDPAAPPLTPGDALDQLLRGLGADPDLPGRDVSSKAGYFRSLLASRRVVIVLDNAVGAEQVRPLLPGTPGCLVIVTSRNRLAGLVARDGAVRLSIDVLSADCSQELLRRILGAAVVEAQPATARELASYCGYLPLALRIAAELAHEHYDLSEIVDQLRGRGRLDRLSPPDDESSAIRSVLASSYRVLAPDDARAFRLVGLHPAATLGVPDCVALLGIEEAAVRGQLDRLVRWHLLEQVAGGRYRFHDLLRLYAAECAAADEPSAAVTAAIERLIGWYTGAVIAARQLLAPGLGAIVVQDDLPEPGLWSTYREALEWTGRELPALVDVLRLAAERGLDQPAATLATALGALCHSTSRWSEWQRVIELGLDAARRVNDRLSEGRLANDAGVVEHYLGRREEAIASHRTAIEILTALDGGPPDTAGGRPGGRELPAVAPNLAVAYAQLGLHLEDLPLLEKALGIARAEGNQFVEAIVLDSLGAVLSKLGRYDEAIEHGRRSIGLLHQLGAGHMLGHTFAQVGETCSQAGRPDAAIRYLKAAVEVWIQLGDGWAITRAEKRLAEALAC